MLAAVVDVLAEVVELVVELEVVEDEVLELEAVVEVDDVLVELEVSGSPPIHTQMMT